MSGARPGNPGTGTGGADPSRAPHESTTPHESTAPLEAVIATSEAMHAFGAGLARVLDRGDVVVLTGPLGAGKTTLTRGLGEALGVRGAVSSPTFVLARTHPSLGDGPALIHVDAYRLRDALDLDDLDLDLDASVTIIEWGRDVVGAIADAWIEVELERPRAGAGSAADSGAADARPAHDDASDADLESLEAPRRVRITTVGERWTTPGARGVLREALRGAAATGDDRAATGPA